MDSPRRSTPPAARSILPHSFARLLNRVFWSTWRNCARRWKARPLAATRARSSPWRGCRCPTRGVRLRRTPAPPCAEPTADPRLRDKVTCRLYLSSRVNSNCRWSPGARIFPASHRKASAQCAPARSWPDAAPAPLRDQKACVVGHIRKPPRTRLPHPIQPPDPVPCIATPPLQTRRRPAHYPAGRLPDTADFPPLCRDAPDSGGAQAGLKTQPACFPRLISSMQSGSNSGTAQQISTRPSPEKSSPITSPCKASEKNTTRTCHTAYIHKPGFPMPTNHPKARGYYSARGFFLFPGF